MTRRPAQPDGRITIGSTLRGRRIPTERIRSLVDWVAEAEGRDVEHVDVTVVGRRRMATLNRRFLRHQGPTDVISFDLGDGPDGGLCAQIIVCYDIAAVEGRRRGRQVWPELLLYVAHGLLHAMGYDDDTPRRAAKMHRRENELLEAFGVGRVYGDV